MQHRNYVPRCPICNASLDEKDKECRYCGADIINRDEQKTHHDNEKTIRQADISIQETRDAVEEIKSNSRKALAAAKRAEVASKKKKRGFFHWLGIIAVCTFAFFILVGLISVAYTSIMDNLLDRKTKELRNQTVQTITIEEQFEDDFEVFPVAGRYGEIYINDDDIVKIPFLVDSYDHTKTFSGYIYVDISNVDKNAVDFKHYIINFDVDHKYFYIQAEYANYYSDPLDYMYLSYDDIAEIERKDNIELDGVVFETYVRDDSIEMIGCPYPNTFITLQVYDYNDELSDIEDYFPIVGMELDFVLK